ncbi:TRNA pseudouridine synthase/DRAP deaminase [Giardia duodenalis assemblage B]|uniref:tRNA pseudouridine synthase/DRAP deaminase n=1 Tax=Giardia duodenalis assemblage B TaxID=1394984 RepID=A0A132NVQ6_GIAIN|nr:TRNA pseudouridine synthase/DRAP deaminase [Giardia intestinalis assemblage B]
MLPRKQIEDAGLIHLCPYIYVFGTFAKKRWYERSLLKVLCEEFVEYDEEYYTNAAASGQILVLRRGAIYCFVKDAQPDAALTSGPEPEIKKFSTRGRPPSAFTPKAKKQVLYVESSISNFILRDSDLILHVMHRHEPPILAQPVLRDEGEHVFCEKPASMPVHPCGKYCYHSVNELVASPDTKLTTKKGLRACNRIDKLVSGLIVMADSSKEAEQKRNEIVERGNVKVYLANCRIVSGDVSPGNICLIWAPMGLKFKENYTSRCIHFNTHTELFGASLERLDKYNECMEQLAACSRSFGKDVTFLRDKEMLWFKDSDIYSRFVSTKKHAALIQDLVAVQLDPTQSMADIGEHQAAITVIEYVHTDAATETVLAMCVPVTGRTHQLRLHLQAAGTPIHNDPSHGGLQANLAIRCTLPSPSVLQQMLRYEPLSMKAYASKVLERIKAQKSLQSLDLNKIEPALKEISRALASQNNNPCRICSALEKETERDLPSSTVTFYDETKESFNIKYEYIKTYMFTHIDLHSYYYESGPQSICTAVPQFAEAHRMDNAALAPYLKSITDIKRGLMK